MDTDYFFEELKESKLFALTGNYYFNYAKEGGLNLRFFAGKFLYLGDKTYAQRFAGHTFCRCMEPAETKCNRLLRTWHCINGS